MKNKLKYAGLALVALAALSALSVSAAALNPVQQRPLCFIALCDESGSNCPAPCYCLDGICTNP